MDNNISFSSSLTKKLLENKISLNEITLNSFCKDLKIYPSYKEASYKGYEAHHIVPVSKQIKEYNSIHNTNYSSKDRKLFLKNVKNFDDRCYRLSPFEHILIHFLIAREDESQVSAFEAIVRYNWNKLISNEKETLSLLEEFSKMRILGRNKVIECVKKSSNVPKFVKGQIPWNKGKTYIAGWHHSEESKNKISKSNLGKKMSNESRIKMSNSQKEFHKKMSDKEREDFLNKRREISSRPSVKEKIKQKTYQKMNTPEMIDLRLKIKRDYEKQKKELGNNYIRWNQFQKEWFKKYEG